MSSYTKPVNSILIEITTSSTDQLTEVLHPPVSSKVLQKLTNKKLGKRDGTKYSTYYTNGKGNKDKCSTQAFPPEH
jgi:hypothetical protein